MTTDDLSTDHLRRRLAEAAILPILPVSSPDAALDEIDRMAAEGMSAVEILFRTAEAAAVLARAKARHPSILFGAGTMLNAANVEAAVAAGADFLVSPGLTPRLHAIVADGRLPHIPGVQTASEVMTAVEYGYTLLKYYPSKASNAPMVLADYANIFLGVGFVPTGNIDASMLADYAAVPNVVAVGGTWMLPSRKPASDPELQAQVAAFKAGRR
ncbi:bifunctional 4-hydroxy-2-oxoglutarate aldolase/2-dehydro-3-deoxy-phosphogluconate aldolase [Labrys monachus]|uniref:2-dehydro-3-deoxyphosphogluconate aldolase/(4S)-4-hydroxy-2-oxoglutarate aldolase n=1 Tax=Labrys monachus TaxID=217067 RepID=A0ABU0F9Z2_9HYPH|nr:bifunctional 4-hydroxy-2-oxoglutarate aldolase/2-dehydro-3-deoxy-phosphogluconate aldolase [Labrys monachus]MDQ0391434.1 2-dehydro-3-deoxyphosphogluconate aldolase/(4S)-4-hydroxy-2-oxoglutarate aldolase [Labrys monachus]